MIGSTPTRILVALMLVYERDGRATFRSVADEVGFTVSYVWRQFLVLRDAGLVDWEYRRSGTLRPLVGVVPTFTAVIE